MAHVWLSSFIHKRAVQGLSGSGPVQCDPCNGSPLTYSVTDNYPNLGEYTYSRGNVVVGYYDSTNNNAPVNTGAVAKSSGNATPSIISGNSGGGTLCDTGFVDVTAMTPTQGTGPFNGNLGFYTIIQVIVNNNVIGTVNSSVSPNLPVNTNQVFTYTRGTGDIIEIVFGSAVVPSLQFVDQTPIYFNSNNNYEERTYNITPLNAIPYLGAIPAGLDGAGVYASVWSGFISVGIGSIPENSVFGTITLYHPDTGTVLDTLDVYVTGSGGGGSPAPKGGIA